MANTVKLANDLYLETASIVHNKETLDNVINNLKEKVLWTGKSKINGLITTSKDLSGMPNLTNYTNKYIRFCFNYGNNSFVRDVYLTSVTDWQFVELCRDYSGNYDAWHILFGLYNLNSTTWKIKTVHSYTITNSSISVVDNDGYSWYITRVSVLGS